MENIINRKLFRSNLINKLKKDKYYPRKKITLCGSTKFKKEFENEMKRLTLEGNIVFTPTVFSHSDNNIERLSEDDKINLVDCHIEKILMSDAIRVINKDNYIGENTKKEIDIANKLGIEVSYLEPINE